MKLHAFCTGTVEVKESLRTARRNGFLPRMIDILRDDRWTEAIPVWSWAVEHPEGIVVIDTGATTRLFDRLGWRERTLMRKSGRVHVQVEDEIGPQLERAGIEPRDVRSVILTHLHCDHADGLEYFPHAEVWLSRREYRSHRRLSQGSTALPRLAIMQTRLVEFASGPAGPFPKSETVTEAGDLVLVPTPGHTAGHQSVLLRDGETTIFFAGDTTFHEGQLRDEVMAGVVWSRRKTWESLARIRQFVQETPTVYLPSHDGGAGERLNDRQTTRLTD